MIKLCGRCCQHFLYQHLVCHNITIIIHLVSESHQPLKVVIYLLITLHFHQLILSPQILKLRFLYICPTFIALLKDILCTLGIFIFNILLKHLNINILVNGEQIFVIFCLYILVRYHMCLWKFCRCWFYSIDYLFIHHMKCKYHLHLFKPSIQIMDFYELWFYVYDFINFRFRFFLFYEFWA